jgi:phosphate transport system substrate-binding protein
MRHMEANVRNERRNLSRLIVLGALLGAACGGAKPAETTDKAQEPAAPEKPAVTNVRLQGAGASFPAPIYNKWFKDYGASHPNVQVDYQSVGSGSGVKAVIDKTVDFGASDAAMTPEEIARVADGVQLLPMTAGSIVLAYNLEGVSDLKLTRKVYSEIFLGKVKAWNDKAIAASNPGVKLPNAPINVVVRADSSGTTFVFTKHLSEISPEFATSPGTNKMPSWPVGTRSKGNEGVTAAIKTTPGSIGYVEFGYAKSQNMTTASLENKSGKFIAASTASGQAALAGVEMPANLIAWVADPAGEAAYPIVTFTWLILYEKYKDEAKLNALRDLVKYSINEGQKSSEALGYIPLPQAVADKVLAAVENVKVAAK